MNVIKVEVGNLGTNCYIVYCAATKEAAVVDPGGSAAEIMAVVRKEKLQVKYIINTHGHADHIAANNQVQAETGAQVLIHSADAAMLTNAQHNLSQFIGGSFTCQAADKLLNEGDQIQIGNSKLQVIHTPGHTLGGICLLGEGVLLAGDTLFAESIGRTDFPGGSYKQLIQNIKEKLMVLADDVKVYPGHGPETTIGWERKMNSFIV